MGGYIGRGQPVAAGGNSVETADIIDDAVTNAKIATNAVTGDSIASNAVGNSELSDNAVNTAEIADDAITVAKLANSINTDIATGPAALPKAGGTMTGNIAHAGNFTLDVGGNITLDADNGFLKFADGGTDIAQFAKGSNSNLEIKSLVSNADIIFQGNDGGSAIEAMRIDMSEGGMVGIGESAPQARLHVVAQDVGPFTADTAGDDLIVEAQNAGISIISLDAGDGSLIWGSPSDPKGAQAKWNHDSNALRFRTSKTDAKLILGGGNSLSTMTLDGSGNVGIGATPEAWQSTRTALQIGDSTAVWGDVYKNTWFTNNVYRNSSNNECYINASYASEITMTNGGIMDFKVAPSGSADATIAWETAMSIANNGNITWTGELLHATTGGRVMDLGAGGTTANDIKIRAKTGYGGALIFQGDDGGSGTKAELHITTETACGGLAFFSHKSNGGLNERFRIDDYGGNTGDIHFFDGETGNPGLTWDCSANTLKLLNGNLIIGTSGKGIDFSATANSSGTMSSEVLDDYEEGTFTPEIVSTSAFSGQVYATQTASYTKIGNRVLFNIYVRYSNKGTLSGNYMKIIGLPFTPSSSPTYEACAINAQNDGRSSPEVPAANVYGANSFLYLYSQTTTSTTQVPIGRMTNNTEYRVSGHYNT